MKSITRWLAGLGLLAALHTPAQAQVIGVAGAGGMAGAGGIAGMGGIGFGAAGPRFGGGVIGAYGLSTVGGGNPYFGGGGLSVSPYGGPYGLSTIPYTGRYIPPYTLPYNNLIGMGMGRFSNYGNSYSGYLQGFASLTAATGQYQRDIQEARLTRYKANNAALENARNILRHEAWLENHRYLGTQAVHDRQMAADLASARRDAPRSEIWSGKALNDLLRSVIDASSKTSLARGPNLDLSDDTLKHINLSTKATSGNAGMLRDGGKLTWPVGLQEESLKEPRERLSRKLEEAVASIKDGKEPSAIKLREINDDFAALQAKLNNDTYNDLRISDYLAAKRYLAQLKDAISALRDPNIKNFFNNTWNAKGRTVAELVDHMRKEGLAFNSAAPGDEAAYTSLYHALRSFEAGLTGQR